MVRLDRILLQLDEHLPGITRLLPQLTGCQGCLPLPPVREQRHRVGLCATFRGTQGTAPHRLVVGMRWRLNV